MQSKLVVEHSSVRPSKLVVIIMCRLLKVYGSPTSLLIGHKSLSTASASLLLEYKVAQEDVE